MESWFLPELGAVLQLPTREETISSRLTLRVFLSGFLRRRLPDFGRHLVQVPEKRKTRNRKSIGPKRECSAAVKSLVKSIREEERPRLEERCAPRQKSRLGRLKAKVEPLLT